MQSIQTVNLDNIKYEDEATEKVASMIIVPSPEGYVSLPVIKMDDTPWIYLGKEATYDLFHKVVEILSNGYKITIEQFENKCRVTASSPKTNIVMESEKFYPYFRSDRTGVYLTFVLK